MKTVINKSHLHLGISTNFKLYNVYLLHVCATLSQYISIITQPTIYRVIAYFSLYHELASDRSIVLDITWDYTMAWYPAQKIIYYGLVAILIDIRAIAVFHMFT